MYMWPHTQQQQNRRKLKREHKKKTHLHSQKSWKIVFANHQITEI